MKKSTTFIFIAVLLLIPHVVLSQAFFMPEYEKRPQYERLAPIKSIKNAQKIPTNNRSIPNFQKNYEIERYVLVNGVYTPVYKKKTPKNINQPSHIAEKDHPQVIKIAQPTTDNEPEQENLSVAEVEPFETIETNKKQHKFPDNLNFTDIDLSLPNYKNIYSQYLLDTQTFSKTGKFPHNADLEKALAQLSGNKTQTLFSGTVKTK